MKYCKKCVQPDTRPDIYFNEDGICGACLWEVEKKHIDWGKREKELAEIAEHAKNNKKGPYDCTIGVSGGKDSTFQAVYAKEVLGLRPLLVNCAPSNISDIGRANLDTLYNMGFDIISVKVDPIIQKKLMIASFYKHLNVHKATEYPLWASAYIMADKFDIPLVIQGENAEETLGTVTNDDVDKGNALNVDKQNTIKTHPINEYQGTGLTEDDLFFYSFDKQSIIEKGIKAIWLGHYTKEWSQPHNADFAIKRGLILRDINMDPYKVGIYRRYYQLDLEFLEVNQFFKYIKFGFGQATDHVCYDIRDGAITRDEGVFLVKELDGACGQEYIDSFCDFIGIDESHFWQHVNKFRGDMWELENGKYSLKNPVWEQNPPKVTYSVKDIMNRLGI